MRCELLSLYIQQSLYLNIPECNQSRLRIVNIANSNRTKRIWEGGFSSSAPSDSKSICTRQMLQSLAGKEDHLYVVPATNPVVATTIVINRAKYPLTHTHTHTHTHRFNVTASSLAVPSEVENTCRVLGHNIPRPFHCGFEFRTLSISLFK